MAPETMSAPASIAPPDNRGKMRAGSLLSLVLALVLPLFMRCHVKVAALGTTYARKFTVPFWQTIPVYVCSTRSEDDPFVTLKPPNASGAAEKIGEIDARSPGMALWKKTSGYLADKDAKPEPEIEIPYHAEVELLVASDDGRQRENTERVQVTTGRWIDGKIGPIIGSAAALLVGLILWKAASKQLPLPPQSAAPTPPAVCAGGRPLQ